MPKLLPEGSNQMNPGVRLEVHMRMAAIAAVVILALLSLAMFAGPVSTNCGGNSAALSVARQYALFSWAAVQDSPDGRLQLDHLTAEQKSEITPMAHSHWIRTAKFYASSQQVRRNAGDSPIPVFFCDTAFTNVPERWLFHNAPTHAVGFSDGSAKLLSVKDYNAIDKNGFVPLDRLIPKKQPLFSFIEVLELLQLFPAEVPAGRGYRHVVSVRRLEAFIELIPDRPDYSFRCSVREIGGKNSPFEDEIERFHPMNRSCWLCVWCVWYVYGSTSRGNC